MSQPPESTETACRRRGVSCGACCGPFNLDFASLSPAPDQAKNAAVSLWPAPDGEAAPEQKASPQEPGAAASSGPAPLTAAPGYAPPAAHESPAPLTTDPLPRDLPALLQERAREFRVLDLRDRATVLAYRSRREEREARIPRHNPEIYVCPFFGPVPPGADEGAARPGCMVHPDLTGDPGSQNFSFYGAAICQGYDCPNKEADLDGAVSATLAETFPDWRAYGRLMGDTLLHRALRRAGLLERIADARARQAFIAFCQARLRSKPAAAVTSFEIAMRPYPSARAELAALLDAEGAAEENAALVTRLLDSVRYSGDTTE